MSTTAQRPPKLPPAWFKHTFWRCHRALYWLSRGRFLGPRPANAGGVRCISPRSAESPAESAT